MPKSGELVHLSESYWMVGTCWHCLYWVKLWVARSTQFSVSVLAIDCHARLPQRHRQVQIIQNNTSFGLCKLQRRCLELLATNTQSQSVHLLVNLPISEPPWTLLDRNNSQFVCIIHQKCPGGQCLVRAKPVHNLLECVLSDRERICYKSAWFRKCL